MSGNVWEWCLNKSKTPEVTTIDQSGDWRVLRGGSWGYYAGNVRSVYRYDYNPGSRLNYYGFRVVAVRPPSQ
jgi:formylglycine-generating enzyme required for sulfatase activity